MNTSLSIMIVTHSLINRQQWDLLVLTLVAFSVTLMNISTDIENSLPSFQVIVDTIQDLSIDIHAIRKDVDDIEKLNGKILKQFQVTSKVIDSIEASTAAIDVSTGAASVLLKTIDTTLSTTAAQVDAIEASTNTISAAVAESNSLLRLIADNTVGIVKRTNLIEVLNTEIFEITAPASESIAFTGDVCEYDPLGVGPIVCEGSQTAEVTFQKPIFAPVP